MGKGVIVINVVVSYFWATFKKTGFCRHGASFFFSPPIFPHLHLLKGQWCVFWRLFQSRPLGETLFKAHYLLSPITHPQEAARRPVCWSTPLACRLPRTCQLLVVFCEASGRRGSWAYLPWSKQPFDCFFWSDFLRLLEGTQTAPPTPQKLRTAGLSQLAFLQALGVFATNTKRISKGYSKNNRLKLVRPLASERGPGGPNIYPSADRETGHFNRFLSNARMP